MRILPRRFSRRAPNLRNGGWLKFQLAPENCRSTMAVFEFVLQISNFTRVAAYDPIGTTRTTVLELERSWYKLETERRCYSELPVK